MQIDGGKNDKFAAWADSGGLVMGYFDGSTMALWKLAQQYMLADNFFKGAFGGSFLNHQYLICACAPEYPNADTAAAQPTIAVLDTDATGKFTAEPDARGDLARVGDRRPARRSCSRGNIAPKNYFGDGTFRAVNTMQPPYQPSGNAPRGHATRRGLYATTRDRHDAAAADAATTIGDLLDRQGRDLEVVRRRAATAALGEPLGASTTTRVPELPGAPPAVQLLREPGSGDARRRRARRT